ncbi:Swd2p [Sugiyamaella lignohabitans]|uniref:Swd2p n=1 Tax=Sugiyamaella lignohabitans TaxID=796027 RepID=A0A167F7I9_9ASCO|nr:Swd2p [Sugiyamaella lignohabitans]ANB14912.1 Swd2p [Sugiyamaella lignohabitans]
MASSPSVSSALPFNLEVMASFRPSKTLRNHKEAQITSLDFDDSGLYCITTANETQDESIQLYDCKTGKHSKTIFSKKYGANLARFTHNSMNCVYASTKEDDTIRYLSLHDNHFIRYFKGHKDRVTSLEVSPMSDTFISASLDHSVRLWDLRSPSCQSLLNVPGPILVTFDATGVVFIVGCEQLNSIALYDVKNQERPFMSFEPNTPAGVRWCKIEVSNNGNYIMLVTDASTYIYDAYNGTPQGRLAGLVPLNGRQASLSSQCAFSVNGKYIFGGSNDKKIHIWDTSQLSKSAPTLSPVISLDSNQEVAALLAFSPKTMLMATADKALTFWLPDRDLINLNK